MPTVRVATFDGPGSPPVIREVPKPDIPRKAALIRIAACGVCGTDHHILKGHWPRPLPWPFTLGHELAGVISEIGDDLTEDFMGQPLKVGSKVMLPPLMPCGSCYYCVHYPETANKCLNPVYYGRYLGFDREPHLWGGWAEMVYIDLDELPGTKAHAGRHAAGAGFSRRAAHLVHPRPRPRPKGRWLRRGRHRGHTGFRTDRGVGRGRRPGDGCRARHRRRSARESPPRFVPALRCRGHGLAR